MRASTVAIALIPAPPMPTMWMRCGTVRSRSGSPATRDLLDEIRESGGRVGPPERARAVGHGRAPRGIREQGCELALESGRVERRVVDHHRGPGRDQRLGVAGLVIARRTGQR